jgi:hypothetical protein
MWRRNDCFPKIFLSLVDIEDGNILQKKFEKPFTIFPRRTYMWMRVGLGFGLRCRWKHFFDHFLNPISRHVFFFMDRV